MLREPLAYWLAAALGSLVMGMGSVFAAVAVAKPGLMARAMA